MSRAPCHRASLKSMSRTITMQGLIFTPITGAEKCTLVFKGDRNPMIRIFYMKLLYKP